MTVPAHSDGTRKLFHWEVPLQNEGGEQQMYRFSSYWSPDKVDPEFVTVTAAAQARCEQRITLQPTGDAVLVAA
jgi:hypothetical protein